MNNNNNNIDAKNPNDNRPGNHENTFNPGTGNVSSSQMQSQHQYQQKQSHPVLQPFKTPLDPVVMQKASRYAVRVFEEMSKRSKLLRYNDEDSTVIVADKMSVNYDNHDGTVSGVARFDRDEIIPYLGELLGKGGFNNVYELEQIHLNKSSNNQQTNSPRNKILRQNLVTSQPKLAVKFLSDEALMNPEDACNGCADLLMESKYLTALASHPHPALIRLHGISSNGPAGFSSTDRAGFFLIIDRLYDTLDRRIDVWREVQKRKYNEIQASNSNTKVSTDRITKPQQQLSGNDSDTSSSNSVGMGEKYLRVLLIQRLLTAMEIVGALAHLHDLQIVFRDLKPDNIGFDYEGRVKIFDFGLAKELDPKQQVPEQNGLYNMSGGTGSRRFMAPEVSLSKPYGLSADLYSYGILLWELLTLEKAFGRMPVDEHREKVVLGDERPPLQGTGAGGEPYTQWNTIDDLIFVLQGSWRKDPLARPSSRDLYEELKSIIQGLIQKHFDIKTTSRNTPKYNVE